MHANEREDLILNLLDQRGFVSFRDLETMIDGSPATIRRDLERLDAEGRLERVRGGAKRTATTEPSPNAETHLSLAGTTFTENVRKNRDAKKAIGRAAASLCVPGEGVMIDGGSTTLQMCPHLDGLCLSVLTNSLHIVSALMRQSGTRVLVPSGSVFPEQAIILSVFGEEGMPKFVGPKLFMGGAAIGPAGLMQADPVLVAAERRLIQRAETVIVLVDSSKFAAQSGHVVCELDEIDVIITDKDISPLHVAMARDRGIEVIVA